MPIPANDNDATTGVLWRAVRDVSAFAEVLELPLATSRRKIRPVSADAENRPGCGKLQGRTGFELTRAASIDSFL